MHANRGPGSGESSDLIPGLLHGRLERTKLVEVCVSDIEGNLGWDLNSKTGLRSYVWYKWVLHSRLNLEIGAPLYGNWG